MSGRMTSLETARTQLLDVDVDRKKRIDDTIDYFGAGYPRGESLLDDTRAR
jgi:hypothetical protein